MKRTHLSTALLAGLVSMGMAVSANAATFYYDSYGGFVKGSGEPSGNYTVENNANTRTGATGSKAFDVGADSDARNPSTIDVDVLWGTKSGYTNKGPYAGRSGLALSRVIGASVDSNAGLTDFGTLTHFNRPISSGTSLEQIEMQWNLAVFGNQTDANNAEGSNNAGALKNIQHSYTLYNWETANSGYGNNGYFYSTDNGETWVGNAGSTYKCPNSRPAGTLVSPVSSPTPGQVFITDGNDTNVSCDDAHAFLPQEFYPTDFTYDGRKYSVVVSGFSYANDVQNNTFWACEDAQCQGTVKFEILDVTTDVDLKIDKSVLPVTVNSGENVTYTINVTNNSTTDTAANVKVTDTLPAGFTYVSSSSADGFSCLENSGGFTCLLNTLAPGASASLKIVATASAPAGNYTNTATVSSDAEDSDPSNNQDTADNTVVTPTTTAPDLGITKSDSADPVNAGDSFNYIITVNNGGTAEAKNVVLTDTLPAGVTYVSSTSSCSHVSGTVTCNLGDLAVGASTNVTITVQTAASTVEETMVTNTARVTSDTPENPDTLPNTASENTRIVATGTPPPPPPATAQAIPTLSEWGIILMALLIGGFGWVAVRRRDSQLSA